ncbi:MAG: helix-turn-helix domain-containing protein [Streptosporangiaceae bacterium]
MADFADELRALLAARGMSLRQAAREVPCDNGYLSKLAHGTKRPSLAMAARLEEMLDATGRLVPHVRHEPLGGLGHDADEVASAAHEAEADQSRLLAQPGQQSIDSLWEEVLEIARAANRSAWQTFSASYRLRRHALELAEATRSPKALSDLYVIAGQATALMASTAFDLDRWDESAALARSAVSYAALVGNSSLHAWTLGLAALLANWRLEPDIALSHFQRGLQVAPAGIPRARLRYIAARSHALLGDVLSVGQRIDEARRDQADAAQHHDQLSQETGGEFAFGPARAEACAASAWLDLGRGREAKAAAQRALNDLLALPAPRQPLSQVTGARIDLATACLLGRERDEAEDVLHDVIAAPASLGNVSLAGRLARTRETLASPAWSRDPAARQLDDTIGEWLAQPDAGRPG